MHENRETSLASAPADRSGKANSHKPDTHAREESDCAVIPMKQPNKEADVSAEVEEGRAQTKENGAEPHRRPIQSGERVSQGLGGVRQVARERKQERFTALRVVASSSNDKTVRLWDVNVDHWTAPACDIANRNLTPEERTQLFPGEILRPTCPNIKWMCQSLLIYRIKRRATTNGRARACSPSSRQATIVDSVKK